MNRDDYQKVKEGILAADLSSRSKWQLTGGDRIRYLNGQTTCDITRLREGASIWGAVTNIKGRMEGDLRVASASHGLLLDADPLLAETLFNRLSKYIIADDVEFSDVTQDWKLYHLLGATPPSRPDGEKALVFPSNRFGLPGFDFWLPAAHSSAPPCAGEDVWEILRIENGIPRWGIDMTTANLAPEMPFEKWGGLSYSKGCYIGQEVIARVKSIGHVNKQLCLLHSQDPLVPSFPQPCTFEGKNAGIATSGSSSPSQGGTCILATLNRQQAVPGQNIEIDGKPYMVTSC